MKQTETVEAIITLLRVCTLMNDDHHNAMIDKLIQVADSLYNEMTDEDLMKMVYIFLDKKFEERETSSHNEMTDEDLMEMVYNFIDKKLEERETRLPRKEKE